MSLRIKYNDNIESLQFQLAMLNKKLSEIKNNNVLRKFKQTRRKGDAKDENTEDELDIEIKLRLTQLELGTWETIFQAEEKQLKALNLSGRMLTEIPEGVFTLTNLTALYLGENQLTTLPSEIEKLTKLETFELSRNKLKTLPTEIGKLAKLTSLNISHNQLTTLPSEVGELANLQRLILHDNLLTDLPNEIGRLINLRTLRLGSDVSGNRLTIFHPSITNLINLEQLEIDNNLFDNIPPEIEKLSALNTLAISRNRLTILPIEIGKLTNLKSLHLSYNHISNIPKEIGNLLHLEKLWLNSNKISSLPFEITKLTNLKTLDLTNNSLSIPPEILSRVGNPISIFDYYFRSEKTNKKRINQAKLLILGQGSVGKTSLVQQILHGTFDPNQTKTEGISINQWQVDEKEKREGEQPSEIRLNIWDFGGQEIMHATHQFFLTKRSLYLLVLDARLTQEENRVEYWLKIIQSFGGESPVLIVGNKTDQHPLDVDRTGLQKKYPNIVGILETSAATGAGIDALKAEIAKQVDTLPHVRDLLPETWFTVKSKLEELGRDKNFITQDEYLSLCGANDVTDETSQRTLIGFLHDLGVILYFQEDYRLSELGILSPQWVTNGVYKIVNSPVLFRNKGVLTVSMLDEILNSPEYPRSKRLSLVDLMKRFELCYDLEPDRSFLVPDLLPKDKPTELEFEGIPAFEYAYPVFHSKIITRFIVRMNQKIDDGLVWRTGVVLKIGENKALVKADIEDRKITIAIDGLEHTRRDALSAIRYQLDEIHNSIKGLNPQKMVPIPNAPNADPLEYEYLLMLEREGQETHLVKDGNRLVKVNVREILSGIESEAQRRETGGNVTNIYIGGDVKGSTIISGDNNTVFSQKIQESVKKAESSSIPPELIETLKLLGEAVDVMNKVLPKEQASETTEDFGKLVDEATKSAPQKKWYSVSVEGLIKAAENVEKVGEPVINLSKKVLSLLTGGVIG